VPTIVIGKIKKEKSKKKNETRKMKKEK